MNPYILLSAVLLTVAAFFTGVLLLVFALIRIGMQIAAQLTSFNTTMDSISKLLLRTSGDTTPDAVLAQSEELTEQQKLLRKGWLVNPANGLWSHPSMPGTFFAEEQALQYIFPKEKQ